MSHAKLLGIAEGSGGKAGLVYTGVVYPNHSKVAGGIVADGGCRHAAAVGQRDFDAASVMDDVAVGENQAIGSEYEPRASTAAFARLAGASAAGGLMHFDVDH